MSEEEKTRKTVRSEIAFIASVITILGFIPGISSIGIFPPWPSSSPEPPHTPVISTSPVPPPVTQTPTVEITPASTRPGPHDLDVCGTGDGSLSHDEKPN